ncbi:MAG: hypothetical protein Crog4KO_35710 [Crocinitomicaceae bacterium]
MYNPYIAGNPVGGSDSFYGRTDILNRVIRVLQNSGEVALTLYGQRRIGKTSILRQLEASLVTTNQYVPVYFDLQDKADNTLEVLLHELANKTLGALNLPYLEFHLFEDKNYYTDNFLPSLNGELGDRSLVVLFDEFDVLDSNADNLASRNLFPYLRKLIESKSQIQNYIFVIGRNPSDLLNHTLSIFKTVRSQRVSNLVKDSTLQVISQSEQNNTMMWTEEAKEAVWDLTRGHPYLTQLLCYVIWENICGFSENESDVPTATYNDVIVSIQDALIEGENAFTWIWEGLPPASRIVIAAIAEAGSEPIDQTRLNEILQDSGVRIVISEMELAPRRLIEWDLLEELDDGRFKYSVELLRIWVEHNKPINRVKDELDRLDPAAESLYKAAITYYNSRDFAPAIEQLQSVLRYNPNHLKAKILLGEIYIEQDQVDDAVKVLEQAYQYDQTSSRGLLIQSYFTQASKSPDQDVKINIYQKILQLSPSHREAVQSLDSLATQLGNEALNKHDFDKAKYYFEMTNNTSWLEEVETARQQKYVGDQRIHAQNYIATEQWEAALNIYDEIKDLTNDSNVQREYENTLKLTTLSNTYRQGIGALNAGDYENAVMMLAEVVGIQPDYEEAVRYLTLAKEKIDIKEVIIPPRNIKRQTFLRSVSLLAFIIGIAIILIIAFLGSQINSRENTIENLDATAQQALSQIDGTAQQSIDLERTRGASDLETQQAVFEVTQAQLGLEATNAVETVGADNLVAEANLATQFAIGTQIVLDATDAIRDIIEIENAQAGATTTSLVVALQANNNVFETQTRVAEFTATPTVNIEATINALLTATAVQQIVNNNATQQVQTAQAETEETQTAIAIMATNTPRPTSTRRPTSAATVVVATTAPTTVQSNSGYHCNNQVSPSRLSIGSRGVVTNQGFTRTSDEVFMASGYYDTSYELTSNQLNVGEGFTVINGPICTYYLGGFQWVDNVGNLNEWLIWYAQGDNGLEGYIIELFSPYQGYWVRPE